MRVGLCIGLLSLMLSAGVANARAYYVSPSGDDAHSGGVLRPYRTIQRAIARAEPGDSVFVRAGRYAGFTVDGVHATAERPLTISAEPGVVIDEPGPVPTDPPLNTASDSYEWSVWPHAITILRSDFVIVEGFEVTGMPVREYDADGTLLHKGGAGVYAEASVGLTFRHNNCHDNGRWGLFTAFCDDLVIEYNTTSRSILEHGIYLSNSGDRATVRYNHSFGNFDCGIQINADNAFDNADYRGFADPDGVSQGNLIEYNVIHGNGIEGGAAINLDGVSDSVIRGNVLFNNHATGIALFQESGRTGSQRNVVSDNWISMAEDARWAINILGCVPEAVAEDGTCIYANEARLPEWAELRPTAYASGSTGNAVWNNVVLNASTTSGAVYIDAMSLTPDAAPGARPFASDYNTMVNQFQIAPNVVGAEPELIRAREWRHRTGQDLHSVVVPAPR